MKKLYPILAKLFGEPEYIRAIRSNHDAEMISLRLELASARLDANHFKDLSDQMLARNTQLSKQMEEGGKLIQAVQKLERMGFIVNPDFK